MFHIAGMLVPEKKKMDRAHRTGLEQRRFAAARPRSVKPAANHPSNEAGPRRVQLNAISERLFEAFPQAFKYPPVPLAIGTGPKLCELLGAEFKPAEIRRFLHAWTTGPRYLKALVRGEMRRHLDGSAAGLPEPKHRAAAEQRLEVLGHSGPRPPA